MKSPISPDRLKELRRRNRLSQGELAERSLISKDTISRLERGVLPGNRNHTIDQLSKALEVPPGVLTGELPLPDAGKGRRRESRRQVPVRISGSALNALQLVSHRYQVPMIRVLEIAPVLFLFAAEESLDWRRQNLRSMKAAYQMRRKFSHLNVGFLPEKDADRLIAEEEKSISQNDILAETIPDSVSGAKTYSNETNPFSSYLAEKSMNYSEDLIWGLDFGKEYTSYFACSGDALDIAGGDEMAQEWILMSEFLLSDIPKHLWADDALPERLAWMEAEATSANKPDDDIAAVLESEA